MAVALFVAPLLFALLAVLVRSNRVRPRILLLAGVVQVSLVGVALFQPDISALDGWIVLGPFARLALAFISILFLACCVYAQGYLAHHIARGNSVFCACMLIFMAMMALALEAQHLGLMWVAIEATTLASAPLLNFDGSQRTLEATWKYLMVGSVGIALALLGSFFLAYSAFHAGLKPSLLLSDMVTDAPKLSRPWLRSAFILLFIGYGTKMGLAPMHTWKPDAYGEAPGVVGTLLAGGLTNCAFIAIVRFYKVCWAAGDPDFARELMIVIGILSMAVAGVFMAGQKDFKRMLAYSSVEHMGILILGVGIGDGALFGSMLHMLNNGLTKGILFLSAANIQRAYASKTTDDVRGALGRVPLSAGLLLAGFFAITGSPPFGPFFSEFAILNAAIGGGRWIIASLFLVMLVIVFIGMGATVMTILQGAPSERAKTTTVRDRFTTTVPGLALLVLVLVLGVYIPRPVEHLVQDAAAAIEATR